MGVTVNSRRPGTVPIFAQRKWDCPVRKQQRRAFTLVELLMVIAIIGILIGLITAAAIAARTAAKRAAIRMEIDKLDAAVERYKSEHLEYPPDFFGIGLSTNPTGDPDLRSAGIRAVVRHLRRAYPRYWGLDADDGVTWNHFCADLLAGYGIDPNQFDPASALMFWLAGLPEQPGDIPSGFHSDPARPFRPGGPRTGRLFDLDKDRWVYSIQDGPGGSFRYLRYIPPYLETPYVYFRARKEQFSPPTLYGTGRYEYGVVSTTGPTFRPFAYYHSADNVCAAYLDKLPDAAPIPPPDPSAPGTRRLWRNAEKFQIIAAGLDSLFDAPLPPAGSHPLFRLSRSGVDYVDPNTGLVPWSLGDMDNQTNFAQGTLEDELQ